MTLTTRHPSAFRARSRARSRSNPAVVLWVARPSSSTMSRTERHTKSHSSQRPRTLRLTLTSGRGRPLASRKARKRSSSSLRVTPEPTRRCDRIALSAAVPRRRGWRARRSSIESGSRRRRDSASSIARSRRWLGRTAARSRSVRDTLVTGMPSWIVVSSAGTFERWGAIGDRTRTWRWTVTSIIGRGARRTPQSDPAERWLSTEPGEAARTAAIQRPRTVSMRCPTAYTPRCTAWSRPFSSRFPIARRPRPISSSWRRAITPCWRSASPAMIPSHSLAPGRA